MVKLDEEVTVFDPVVDTVRHQIKNPSIDTWHSTTLITRTAREALETVSDGEDEHLDLSGGMTMNAKSIEIGVRIGNIHIGRLKALVVDDGFHDILFGRDILEHVFRIGTPSGSDVTRVSSAWKDDPTAVAIELYPVSTPVTLRNFERFIKMQRRLHNLALVASGDVILRTTESLKSVIEDEQGIPDDKCLKLTWVDNGSIWITVKSGSRSALNYMTNLFDKGAKAKLTQEMSAATEAESKAKIDADTREATIQRVLAEEDRLRVENIAKTYAAWREETLAQIDFADEVLSKTDDPMLQEKLRIMRDSYIRQIAEQGIVPIVRNVPHDNIENPNVIALPKSDDLT